MADSIGEDQVDYIRGGIPLTRLCHPDVPASPTHKMKTQSKFLKLVKHSDTTGVRQLLSDDHTQDHTPDHTPDLHALDAMGRSAYVIAIDQNDYGMIQCLLVLSVDPDDALYHAIETHNYEAVLTICKHLTETKKEEVLNRFPKTRSWPSTCKPLILAARQEDCQIVQCLIWHGVMMPSIEELYLQVDESDSYGKFLALLHWYEAISSETYIMLTSNNPIETIFEIAKGLEKAMKVPRFKEEGDRILLNLQALSTKLLGLARGHDEVKLLLTSGEQTSANGLPLRLQQALDLEFKGFVSHPSCQDYMESQWSVLSPYVMYYTKSRIMSALSYALLMVFFQIPCLLYILLPVERIHMMRKPFIRFLLHMASRLYFLLLLVLSTIRPEVVVINHIHEEELTKAQKISQYIKYRSRPWDVFTILIIIWIIGMTFRSVREAWVHRRDHYIVSWGVIDISQLVFYWIFIIMSTVAFLKAKYITEQPGFISHFLLTDAPGESQVMEDQIADNASMDPTDVPLVFERGFMIPKSEDTTSDVIFGNYGNETRYDWDQYDPLLVAEAAFAVANVLTYLHLLHCFLILDFLGPLLISFRGMVVDVAKFLFILVFILISFSLGLTQLYRTFEMLDLNQCLEATDKSQCASTPFLTFWTSMQSLFWSMFNLIDLENLSVDNDLYFTEFVGTVLYLLFMIVAVVVLLNALIAMMSNTYTRIEENAEEEWKVARTMLMAEYMTPAVTLPPPFNLIPTLKSVLRLCRFFHRKCSDGNAGNQPVPIDEDAQETKKKKYKLLMLALVDRLQRAKRLEKMKKQKHKGKGKQEVAASKMDVETLREEIKELRRLIQEKTSDK